MNELRRCATCKINHCKIEIDVRFVEYIHANYQHCAASDDTSFSHVSYHISRVKQILKLRNNRIYSKYSTRMILKITQNIDKKIMLVSFSYPKFSFCFFLERGIRLILKFLLRNLLATVRVKIINDHFTIILRCGKMVAVSMR